MRIRVLGVPISRASGEATMSADYHVGTSSLPLRWFDHLPGFVSSVDATCRIIVTVMSGVFMTLQTTPSWLLKDFLVLWSPKSYRRPTTSDLFVVFFGLGLS